MAIDKDSYKIEKKSNNEYIYLFENEKVEDLIKTKLHCVYYKNCDFVDVNLTKYEIDCIKKANIKEKDFDKLPENCKKYVEFIEKEIGYPITMVSNGPGREDIIYRESPLKA